MANRTQQSCETDSPKCLRTTLTSRPVFTSEHTTLYTRQPGGLPRNRKFSVESKVLSWVPYGIHKAPFDITVTLNVCEGENSQIPKQSPMFFFTCNSCNQSQQVKFNFLWKQHRYDPIHRESEPPIFAANPSLRTIHVNHSQSLT